MTETHEQDPTSGNGDSADVLRTDGAGIDPAVRWSSEQVFNELQLDSLLLRTYVVHTRKDVAMAETSTDSRRAKSQRINLRTTEHQEALLRRAAEATDNTLTEFIMTSAVEHAERVLADRRWFTATDEQYAEFLRLLDAPLPATDKFERLFARQPPNLTKNER